MALENITRTFLSGWVQTHALMGLPVEYMPFMTVNERLDILPDEQPSITQMPFMGCYMIGNGGHKNTVGADNIPLTDPRQHSALHGYPYKAMPFVLRELSADLTAAERQKYALRKIVNIKGDSYVAYYAKRINRTGLRVRLKQHVYENGAIVLEEDYVPDNSVLNPEPMPLTEEGINVLDGRYVVSSAEITLHLNRAEIDDILNAAKIMYDDERYGIISEVQLLTGVDRTVSVSTPGQGSFNFNEFIGAMVINHLNTNYPLVYANEFVNINFEVGSSEPLFKLTVANTEP